MSNMSCNTAAKSVTKCNKMIKCDLKCEVYESLYDESLIRDTKTKNKRLIKIDMNNINQQVLPPTCIEKRISMKNRNEKSEMKMSNILTNTYHVGVKPKIHSGYLKLNTVDKLSHRRSLHKVTVFKPDDI